MSSNSLFNFFNSLTQKIFLPLWGILTAFILVDITTRLTNYETSDNSRWKIESASENNGLMLNQEQELLIINAINNYEITTVVDNASTNDRMSSAEQLAQHGDLSQLYAGKIRYRLVGIFDKKERFAVIEQMDTSVNEKKLIRISTLANIQNYKITKIAANKVLLISTDHREISLYLYQKSDEKSAKQLDKK